MNGYTKLFSTIITSTLWSEDSDTRIVWITMLAMADQHGEVQASIPGLARMAGVPLKITEKAISMFLETDTYSRTKEYEGRRIEEIDGGWVLLNHAKYRHMASVDDQREKTRLRVQKHRAGNDDVTLGNDSVTVCNNKQKTEADTKAEADLERESADAGIPTWKEVQTEASMQAVLPETAKSFFDYHQDQNYWINNFGRLINWRSKLRNWKVKDQIFQPNKPTKPKGKPGDPFGGMTNDQILAASY